MRRVHSLKRWVRIPKTELVGGPADGAIISTRLDRIVYPVLGGHFCYVHDPQDTFADYRRAFFQGACIITSDENGDFAIIML